MIPLKLQIKNFLSYGSETQIIDFEPHQLICLSGKNGHGKSALLDAITWALWGQARKISGVTKADEGLVKIGKSNMMVTLDFQCNNQKYRIKREYGKTAGKPYSTLDFGLYNKEEKLISLSEKRIRQTQKKIENTLSLTIDTFVNSAFLRQGQANEFSKKSPKDRKEIFAQILGLTQYDFVRKLASQKAKNKLLERDSVLKFQEKIELELQKKDEINKQISELEKNLENTIKHETEIHKNQEQIRIEKKKLTEEQKNKQILEFKQHELLKKEEENQKQIILIRDKWRQVHKSQINMPNQAILHKTKNTIVETINKHQKTLQKRLQIKEDYIQSREAIQKIERNFYENYNKEIQDKKLNIEKLNITLENSNKKFKELVQNQLDKNSTKKELENEIKKLKDTISINSINKKELEREEEQFEKRKEHYQKYITQGNGIKKELNALEQKRILSQDQDKPCCPLCEQNLSASRKNFLKTKFTKQEIFYNHRLLRLSKTIQNLKEKLITQHEIIKKLKNAHEKNKLTEVRIKEIDKNIKIIDKEVNKANIEIKKVKENQKTICQHIDLANKELKDKKHTEKSSLEKNTEHQKLIKQIDKYTHEVKSLQYNPEEHKNATLELKKIETLIEQYEKIRQEISLQEERKKNISNLCTQLKNIKKEKIILNNKIIIYKNIEQKQKELEEKEIKFYQELKINNKQKEYLLQNKGSLENQISKLKQQEQEHKNQQVIINNLNQEYEDYKVIAQATGKDGIQAFLIENAIPEVEQETNNILSKLTNNQSQIFIESLRDLKKGGTKETLDIKISDAAGIRQYELFSGGEAFRIDFALRIAISKLLARRAGTALKTLIIDEGFGSQDEEGLAKIMDAIYKIQDDFSKVIIVSHLSALKDQFPVHFHVQKGPDGSHVNVIQQG